jgi:GNAT superfamily N-acetyltransferase
VRESADADIRPLGLSDLNEAFALSSTAGWNQRLEDWRMLLQLAPRGSVAAFVEKRIVGTAIGIDYGAFGWIAMMLVDPVFRGHGVGARLLEAAMDALRPDLPVRLDATPLGRPLYQRYGFEDETMITRHEAEPSKFRVVTPASLVERADGVRPLTGADLPGVVARDAEIFGAKRAAVIEGVFAQAPQYACALSRSQSGSVDYCLGRPGRLFDQIGPVVAADHDVARVLVGAALRAAAGRPVIVDAFDSRRTFVGWLGECGFEAQRPLYRMCRPGREAFARNDHRASGMTGFAILGPEFG